MVVSDYGVGIAELWEGYELFCVEKTRTKGKKVFIPSYLFCLSGLEPIASTTLLSSITPKNVTLATLPIPHMTSKM